MSAQLFAVDWLLAISLVVMGIFTLAVVLPGVEGLARGSRELRLPPISREARRALVVIFATIGTGFVIAGIVVIITGLI